MHRQMYYTSCETGLSGYAGFQFNAATPGTPDEALRRVESLTVYEPPRSIGHSPTPSQVAACPVNLCFDPGDQPVLANVTFVGADYSGRFGNYFVHALLGDGQFGPLPIELWKSGLWTARESATTDLPAVEEPVKAGSLSRAAVERFLTSSGGRKRLPALLAAVELAVTGGERSVVIYDRETDDIAHWIAAVSYLLPPRLVERMSFATYQHRPGTSRQHVIGTVPGAEFDPSAPAFETFYLFDFINNAASEVPDRPLVATLASTGLIKASSLWRSADNLATGTEESLEDWHPVVLTAKVLTGDDLAPADVVPVLDWLETAAARLPPASVEQVGRAALRSGACSETDLVRLARAAGEAGAAELHEELEEELVTRQIQGRGTEAAQIRTARGFRRAERLYQEHVNNDNPDELARLIPLAARHGIRLDPAVLAERGRETIGPLLFGRTMSERVRQLLRTEASIRTGVLDYLENESFERQLEAFTGELDGTFEERDFGHRHGLRRAALIAAARSGEADKVTTILKVADGSIDHRLLEAVSPSWTLSEAVQLLREAGAVRFPADWLESLIVAPAIDRKLTADLFLLLTRVNVDRPFSERVDVRIKRMTWALGEERKFAQTRYDKDRREIAIALILAHNDPDRSITGYLKLTLPELLLELRPEDAVEALGRHATSELHSAYLSHAENALTEPGPAAFDTAAHMFAVAWLAADGTYRSLSDTVEAKLIESLKRWGSRDLKQVGKAAKKYDKKIVDEFDPWCDMHFRRRLLPKWRLSRD